MKFKKILSFGPIVKKKIISLYGKIEQKIIFSSIVKKEMAEKIIPGQKNMEFQQLEDNEVQQTNIKRNKTFDDILTNSIKFGKYQYISAIIICNHLEYLN